MSIPVVTLTGSALTGIAPQLEGIAGLATLPHTVRLGRRRPKARPMALPLGLYLDAAAVAPPASVDYASKAMASLSRMYMNDQLGCCVVSSSAHIMGVWSGNDTGIPVLATDQEIVSSYRIWNPGNQDHGCNIVNVLNWMQTKGLPFQGATHKIDGYVSCDWRNKTLVQAATWLFGNLKLGINLPEEWTRKAVWDVTSSRVIGGHDVPVVDYSPEGVRIASWGRLYLMTWPAFLSARWLEECYCLLGSDWYNDDQLAPNGVKVQALVEDLQKIKGGTVPPIDPGPPVPPGPAPPTPTPGPTPPPSPAPPPGKLFSLTFPQAVPAGGMVRAFRTRVAIPAGTYDVFPRASQGEEVYAVEADPEDFDSLLAGLDRSGENL